MFSKSRYTVRMLCEGALMIALATILGFLPLYKMPWGGSIDLAMLPVFLFCTRWGVAPGLLVGTALGILQTLFEGGAAIGWQSILGDFLLAYCVLGLAGLSRNFYLGTLIGSGARFLVHYVVGATIWSEYMPPVFFSITMTSPWIYSALYNGFYMSIDCLAILLIGLLLRRTSASAYLTRCTV